MTEKNKRLVVYTCVIDDYDLVLPPVGDQHGIDFILFSNLESQRPLGWKLHVIDKPDGSSANFLNRQYKFFPHKFLSNYDYSLYVDGNIRIIEDLNPLFQDFIHSGMELGLFLHPSRTSVIDEIAACFDKGKIDEKDQAMQQINYYESLGFKDDVGLTENSMILRKHRGPSLEKAMDLWWEHFNKFEQRDQLSLSFVRWKLQIPEKLYTTNARKGDKYFYRYGHLSANLLDNFRNMVRARRFDNSIYRFFYLLCSKLKRC